MTTPDALLDPETVARRLAVGVRTLEAWRWRGNGPPFVRLPSRAIRYPERLLNAWIAARTFRSTADTAAADGGAAHLDPPAEDAQL